MSIMIMVMKTIPNFQGVWILQIVGFNYRFTELQAAFGLAH